MNEGKHRFIKFFWSYTLVIIIPVFVLGFLTIGILFRNLDSDTKKLNKNLIEQSAGIIDTKMEELLSLSYNLEQNEKISLFLQHVTSRNELSEYELYDIINELRSYHINNTDLQEIGLYFESIDSVISSRSIDSLYEYYQMLFVNSDYTFERFAEEISHAGLRNFFISQADGSGNPIIMYCRSATFNNIAGKVPVFVVLNYDSFINNLKLSKLNKNLEIAIVDSNKNLIMKSEGFDIDYSNPQASGKEIITVKSKTLNCQYIYALPKGSLSGNVHYFMLMFFMMIVFAVIISFTLANLRLQKMRKMILKVFDENKAMADDLSNQMEKTKERNLLGMLHNAKTDDYNSIDKSQSVSFTKHYFAVMNVYATLVEESDAYSQLVKDAWNDLNRIISDRLSQINIDCEYVNINGQTYAYILNYDTQGIISKLKGLSREFRKNYHVVINLGIGEEVEQADKVYISYDDAVSALRYSLHKNVGECVCYDEIKNIENTKIYYTMEKENLLVRSIRNGSVDDVENLFNDIYRVNFYERHISQGALRRLILNISFSVYKVLDEVYEFDTDKHEKYGRVYQNLMCNENMEECFQILREICVSLATDLDRQTGDEQLKKRIVEYISDNYSDYSLSLEVLADHLEIGYHYLSKLFKEHMGNSFVTYLTLVRLEKAKELLCESNETIEKIAEKTGFVGSHSLIRAFKKYYNTTPGKYRKEH